MLCYTLFMEYPVGWMLPHLFINEGEVMRMNAKDTFILMQFCIIIYLLIIITLLLIIQ